MSSWRYSTSDLTSSPDPSHTIPTNPSHWNASCSSSASVGAHSSAWELGRGLAPQRPSRDADLRVV